MITLEINERFARYFDELDYGQEKQLEKSLQSDLTSEPILWWHNPELDRDEILDGHHRYKIAKRCKIELQTHEKHFESEDAALLFIIRTQTTRRNVYNRESVVKEAVELEIKLSNKNKTAAVKAVAEQTGYAESTIWEDIKPKTVVQQFFEDKKDFERGLERVRNKEIEKLKQRAIKEGYADNEDRLAGEWETIDIEINKQFAEQSAQLEAAAEGIQTAQEADGVRVSLGGTRKHKKSTAAKADKRNTMKKALTMLGKFQSEVLYFWDQRVGTIETSDINDAIKTFIGRIKDEQAKDAKAAKKH